jgi:hypothetical protein
MAISVTHSHVSEVADDPGFDVSSGEWNAAHTITGAAEAYQATSFPGSPTEGLLCYRTDRHVLYQYTGSVWAPIVSHAAMTLYVDPTGTDDSAHGWASGTNAYATINYALSQVPPLYGGNVTINIAAGTYTENVVIRGKTPTGAYSLTLQGALTEQLSTTMTGGGNAANGTSTQAAVTKSLAGWTANAYSMMLCQFTSGSNNGVYRVIESNTTTNLTLVGRKLPATPTNGDSFKILSHAAVVSGTMTIFDPVYITDLSVTGNVTISSAHALLRCKLVQVFWNAAGIDPTLPALDVCSVVSVGETTSAVWPSNGRINILNTYFKIISTGVAMLVFAGSNVIVGSCVFSGDGSNNAGGIVLCHGFLEFWNTADDMLTMLKSSAGVGLYAKRGGTIFAKVLTGVASVSAHDKSETTTYSIVIPTSA